MTDALAEVRAYVHSQKVEEAVTAAISQAVQERSPNAIQRISELLVANQPNVATSPNGMVPSLTTPKQNPKNNILLMTDGYKFSHHKQYPVSWMPAHARPTGKETYNPPIFYPAKDGKPGTMIRKLLPVPGVEPALKITVVSATSTAVTAVSAADGGEPVDIEWTGEPCTYSGGSKPFVVVEVSDAVRESLRLPEGMTKFKVENLDESKLKRGSSLNDKFEGGYNVSYFTPRGYKDQFESLSSDGTKDHIVFFGLQYFIKEYLAGQVVTANKIDEAEDFISRYMADVRVLGPTYYHGFDYTMFPRGDWEAMLTGDYDATGERKPDLAGVLPIKVEALPEGSLAGPGTCLFKITNTHPRFYWLPNFLETLLVQVWYPITVATQAREFRKTIQAYSILSQRYAFLPEELGKTFFSTENVAENTIPIDVAQVFDLLDFGYRGVSSHETASLRSADYYTAGFEGSDTVAGSRMLLANYAAETEGMPDFLKSFPAMFEQKHGATSVPAAEHSTITSWADMSPSSDAMLYEKAEYNAFSNMIKQYMSSFCVSLVSDGFNIWNAITCLWPSEDTSHGGMSMRAMLKERLDRIILTLIRPDSGEGVETLPQMLTLLNKVLPEHWQQELKPLEPVFPAGDPRNAKYDAVVEKIRNKTGADGNPFRRFIGQQMRVLQGDGVALNTVGDMLASLLANGFSAETVHFGSGGGLLQKVNRDSLSCAFKCCAMYVDGKEYVIGKDPIAGGKKSYAGNPAVVRHEDGVLRNRGEYDADGNMLKAEPMTYSEFVDGAKGDVMRTTFKNGQIIEDESLPAIRGRCKIVAKSIDGALTKALDNLTLKADFLQTMTTPEAMCVRLAEASCGSKWMHKHTSKLADLLKVLPEYAKPMQELGLDAEADSNTLLKTIKERHMCSKKELKKVLAALEDDEPDEAMKIRNGKPVLTL
jgi:nicotinamide phosphoribosyltransferase